MKTCTKCGEVKPLEDFHRKGGGRRSDCKVCYSAYRRQRYQGDRQKWIDKAERQNQKTKRRNKAHIVAWLKSHPCVDCGEADLEVLQFDHVDPANKGGCVGSFNTHSLVRLQEEIDKCEIRCANCHLRRTRRMQGWTHEVPS